MVGSLSAGLLLADEAGAHLPSVDDFLPPEILFQGTPFAINRIILIRIVATIVLLVVLGVTAKRAKLIPGRWQGVVEYGLDFVRDKVVYDVMGEARGKRYVPMITTLFFTIFIFNLCGIIPGMNMAANATVVMPLVFRVWALVLQLDTDPVLDRRHPLAGPRPLSAPRAVHPRCAVAGLFPAGSDQPA